MTASVDGIGQKGKGCGLKKEDKFEKMYGKLVDYERQVHAKNQKRIKIGLRCILLIPLIFLILLFWTDSNKVVFLILWITSLFALAVYLIGVEYMDYNLQETLRELGGEEEDGEPEALMGEGVEKMEEKLDEEYF